MSVINKMLRDLDKRQPDVAVTTSSEQALKYTPSRGRYLLWVVLLSGIVLLGFWLKDNSPTVTDKMVVAEPSSINNDNMPIAVAEQESQPEPEVKPQITADPHHILTAIAVDKTPVVVEEQASPVAHQQQTESVLLSSDKEPEQLIATEPKPQLKIERLPETPQQMVQRLKQQAVTAQQNGHFSTAVESWQSMLKIAPENAEAWLGLAQVWQLQGQNQTAYNILLQALQQGVSDVSIQLQLAQLAVQQQNWQQAAEFLTTDFNILAAPEYYGLRATVQQQLGQHPQALQGFQALLQLQPQQGRWWLGAALSLEAMSQPEQAQQYYRQALQWSNNLSAASRHFIQQRLTEAE